MRIENPWTLGLGVGFLALGGLLVLNWTGLLGGGVHEHAELEVYLNSSEPYDFSAERYQLAAREVHLEEGPDDADRATIHIHTEDLTLVDFFATLEWEVGMDGITTDQGEAYQVDGNHTLSILADGEKADRGLAEPLADDRTYVVRFSHAPGVSAG